MSRPRSVDCSRREATESFAPDGRHGAAPAKGARDDIMHDGLGIYARKSANHFRRRLPRDPDLPDGTAIPNQRVRREGRKMSATGLHARQGCYSSAPLRSRNLRARTKKLTTSADNRADR